MQSSLILNDLTCIDHAYINADGRLVGGSLHPTVILTGDVTADENVVIDFSKCKKLVKSLIDDQNTGFDHKLWVLSDSNANVYIHPNMFEVATPCITITTDQHALRSLHCNYNPEEIGKEIANYLEENISTQMGVKIKVECLVSFKYHALHDGACSHPFRYAHGLKSSSSFGCQNIAHGHLSYIQALGENYSAINDAATQEYISDLAMSLDNTYFVFAENVQHHSSNICCIEYKACIRGLFSAFIRTKDMKVKILKTETTIEHLIEHIKERSEEKLKKLGVKYLVVSEGLTKGSITAI